MERDRDNKEKERQRWRDNNRPRDGGRKGWTQRERGRDNHGNSHIDMRGDTEMNRNCEPGPIQSSWQDWAWGVSRSLACSPEWLWALLSRDYNSAGKGAVGRAPSDSGDHS